VDNIYIFESKIVSVTMFVFFLLTGRWLELRLRDHTAGALEALMNRLPQSVQRRGCLIALLSGLPPGALRWAMCCGCMRVRHSWQTVWCSKAKPLWTKLCSQESLCPWCVGRGHR
jgi:hypothetical protein